MMLLVPTFGCLLLAAISALLLRSCSAEVEFNAISGAPILTCGYDNVTIDFETINPFQGNIWVRGMFETEGCKSERVDGSRVGITLGFDACGMRRTRTKDDEKRRGILLSNTIIISFNRYFIAKNDKSFRFSCFYMEAYKIVNTEIDVTPLTTEMQTQILPMPVCTYEILDGGPNGYPIKYVLIGQQVYHKWNCVSEMENAFCMQVVSCFVESGEGEKVEVINEDGCTTDKFILQNLEYPTDLMAGREAHAFKFISQDELLFDCQIKISFKEPDSDCARPQCPETARRSGRTARGLTDDTPLVNHSLIEFFPHRNSSSSNNNNINNVGDLEATSHMLSTLAEFDTAMSLRCFKPSDVWIFTAVMLTLATLFVVIAFSFTRSLGKLLACRKATQGVFD